MRLNRAQWSWFLFSDLRNLLSSSKRFVERFAENIVLEVEEKAEKIFVVHISNHWLVKG